MWVNQDISDTECINANHVHVSKPEFMFIV